MRTQTLQLGEVCEFVRGITFPSGEGKPLPFDNSIACLTTSGVQEDVTWSSRRFVQRMRVRNPKQMLQAGDILISTANSKNLVGKSCLVHRPPFPCTFGAFVTVARPQANLYPSYLAYWMTTRKFLAWCFKQSSNTTNISNLRVSELEELEFSLPDISQQRRIAGRLEQAHQLVRTRRYALELTDTFLPAAFLELFGEASDRFPAPTVDELAADKTHAIRTGPFGSQLLHSEFTDSGIAVLGIDNAVNNEFAWSKRRFITPEKYEELKRYTVFPGDVIITIMGTCGRCAIVPDDIPTAINTKHLCCITLDQIRCLPIYLHGAFLFHPFVRRQQNVATKGSIMDGLNMEIIKGLQIPLPPLPLQQKFAVLAERVQRLRTVQCEALRHAEHLFQTLLHQAFSESA
jgi:type I restriction enzyme, S subunit